MHALSTFHHPMKYPFIFAQESSLDAQNQRLYFPPDIKGVSTAQPMSHSLIRVACSLAVVCGVRLRHIALLFAALFLLPMTKSSIKRWRDAIGAHLPSQEARLRQRLALTPATEGHRDGDYPLGTDHYMMVVKDAHDRLLMTHEAASEPGDEARQFLRRFKDGGLKVTAAVWDDSQSCTEAIPAVSPQARLPADHCPTVKHIWGPRKNALFSYRRQLKASGEAKNDQDGIERAKPLWSGVGASARHPAISLRRTSRPLPNWQERMRGLCTVSAALSGSWCIFSTLHSTSTRSADCTAEKRYPSG